MAIPRALIAMSGGVDSSVAAWLMQQEGFYCHGATMQLLDDADPADAQAVAQTLGMEFHVLDCRDEFRTKVMDYFVKSYEQGLTPNPCIRCNEALKFGVLVEKALDMGFPFVATGHYARIYQDYRTGRYILQKAAHTEKDQSYFLYRLTQNQLERAIFPLGALTKEQVRGLAEDLGFVNAKKQDSQDICFVPDGDYAAFLRQYTGKNYPAGDFLDTDGKVVGTHQGAVCYTLGQRKGLGLAMGTPVYVCGKDMEKNTVTVGPEERLFTDTLIAEDLNFFPFETLTEPLRVFAKTRSRMVEQPATAYPLENGKMKVVFDQPQRAITPGQAVVLYDGETVIGGGTISCIQNG